MLGGAGLLPWEADSFSGNNRFLLRDPLRLLDVEPQCFRIFVSPAAEGMRLSRGQGPADDATDELLLRVRV